MKNILDRMPEDDEVTAEYIKRECADPKMRDELIEGFQRFRHQMMLAGDACGEIAVSIAGEDYEAAAAAFQRLVAGFDALGETEH